jgi:hypothetical protein
MAANIRTFFRTSKKKPQEMNSETMLKVLVLLQGFLTFAVIRGKDSQPLND